MFTDIVGSTRSWDTDERSMSKYMKIHDRIADETVSEYEGRLVKHTGDGIFAVFKESHNALTCALELQRKLQSDSFPLSGIFLRMGLHYGEAQERNRDFFGPSVITAQRVMDAGGGGQILLTEPFRDSCSELPAKIELKALGIQKLRDLSTPIELFLAMHPELLDTVDIPPRTLSSFPNNIERPLTPFVGRQKELHEICRQLNNDEVRLLTLHGPGGTGKTRLSIQAAARECYKFPNGVFFVKLEHKQREEQIPYAIADVLDLKHTEADELEEAIFNFLTNRRMLIVLDNYEQLLPEVDFLHRLLKRTRDLKVLVTSRSRLGLVFENICEIEGLEVPEEFRPVGELMDSQKLYYKTVQRLSGDSVHILDDYEVVGRICCLLRGNPLGVILAASWHGIMSSAEILSRLRAGLGLDSNVTGLPRRHRSLEAVFLFSWNTLSAGEKANLCALSVFRNAFSKKAAEEVCRLDVKDLFELISKSLVEKHEDGTFSIHSLTKDFAQKKTASTIDQIEYGTILKRHCEFFLNILSANSENITEGNRSMAAKRLSGFLEDILAAWEFAIETGSYKWIEKNSRPLRDYLGMRSLYKDGEKLFARSLDKINEGDFPSSRRLQGILLASRGWFSSFCRSADESIRQLRRATEILRDFGVSYELAESQKMLGNVYFVSGDYENALEIYKKTLSIMRDIGNQTGISATLNNLGNLACKSTDYEKAMDFYRESLDIDRKLGNQHGVASTLSNLAITSMAFDDLSRAEEYLHEALEIEKKIGDRFNIAIVKGIICGLLLKKRDFELLAEFCNENLKTYRELGNVWGIANTQVMQSRMLMMQNEYGKASRFLLDSIKVIGNVEWIPLKLDILLVSAKLLMNMGQIQEAASILHFIAEHKSCSEEQRTETEQITEACTTDHAQLCITASKTIDSALQFVIKCISRSAD